MQKFSIKTPVGEISAIESPDPNYPGIWISVNGQELVLVDYDVMKNTHFARVWTKKRDEEGDDPIARIHLESED